MENHSDMFPAAKKYADDQEIKIAKIVEPLRMALTGSKNGPSVFEVIEILGATESAKRLEKLG